MANSTNNSTATQKLQNSLTLPLNKVNMKYVDFVGGKAASLGEMLQNLSNLGVPVPMGFATTSKAFELFMKQIAGGIHDIFSDLNPTDLKQLNQRCSMARDLVEKTPFPLELQQAIETAYSTLSKQYNQPVNGDNINGGVSVAVRSSAKAEDNRLASFAGQLSSFLNIEGLENVLQNIKNCYASVFTARCVSYCASIGIKPTELLSLMSVGVVIQKMIRSDLASAGVCFSLDTESGNPNVVLVTGSWGLGESVVAGIVNPDEFLVFKQGVLANRPAVISKKCGSKETSLIYTKPQSKNRTQTVNVPNAKRESFILNDTEIQTLARYTIIIEQHYGCPMDVEWAKDGLDKCLYIVQARPETVQSNKDRTEIIQYTINSSEAEVLLTGVASGNAIGTGKVQRISNPKQMSDFKPGNVLVADRTDPDWEPIMKKASAIITAQGGRTCHAAIIAREMGVPAVVGCSDNIKKLKTGSVITVSCAEGEVGTIYKGEIPFKAEAISLTNLPQTKTQVFINCADPNESMSKAMLPVKGNSLARMEFFMANLGIHPLEAIRRKQKTQYVEQLALGISKLATAFYPRPVILRLSDFKSNEYAKLDGGSKFEPHEENPMIGWRGASRYYSELYRPAFELELQAVKYVRDVMGLTNIIPMIPFVRTPDELKQVQAIMQSQGLVRGQNGLQVYMMAEVPSNFLCTNLFLLYVDGISIGSNDLTQLTLGLDRDSALLTHLYDERNPAIATAITLLFQHVRSFEKQNGRKIKIGICGQGPSDYPEFTQFLVKLGIDSIGLNADALFKVVNVIANTESKIN